VQGLPHIYKVTAGGRAEGSVSLATPNVAPLESAAPAEFGGPGTSWSPETLLVGAVAACLILTFRAVARASGIAWRSLGCDVEGRLERQAGVLRFTEFVVRARLTVEPGTSEEKARGALEKAEKSCLVSNSLAAARRLEAQVATA
jgi:organic hydroperoxide reductase OsmC/OhrA